MVDAWASCPIVQSTSSSTFMLSIGLPRREIVIWTFISEPKQGACRVFNRPAPFICKQRGRLAWPAYWIRLTSVPNW